MVAANDVAGADHKVQEETPVSAGEVSPKSMAASEEMVSKERASNDPTPNDVGNADEAEARPPRTKKGFGFFAIIAALAMTGLLTSLEATITSTALPTIIADLGGGDLYIWVVNGFYLTQTSLQPLMGQIANIYGRRWPIMISVAMFILGSGLGGGSNNIDMLIAGRLIQGIGSGGINVLIEIIVCDLLPLRERGRYLGLMFGLIALGSALGPLFGGLIVQNTSWRWVFYLNLPIGGAALVVLFAFLRVRSDKSPGYMKRLKRVDWPGNFIFVLSMVAVLIALSWAGSTYPWSSFRVIVPLVLGFVGFGLFVLYEASPFCANPTMPLHHFSNRTSGTAFALTFLHSLSSIAIIYFLPVYFQAVQAASPTESGIHLLPTILFLIPGAIAAGGLMSVFGRYRPLQHAGFALMVLGFGVLTLLKVDSSTGQWVGLQIPAAIGGGLALPVLLPAVQASLTDEDTALSTSTWSFIRSFGLIWGSTIPIAAFDNRINQLVSQINDPTIAAQLVNGGAYERATKTFIDSITDPAVRIQVQTVYVEAIKTVWWVSMAFSALAFVLVIIQKEIPLREQIDTKFGQEKDEAVDRDTEVLPPRVQ